MQAVETDSSPSFELPPTQPQSAARRRLGLRLAFYSHDTVGLGHVRRNLLIAQSLQQRGIAGQTLILSGSGQASVLPESLTDRVVLPALRKQAGCTVSASGASLRTVLRMRARTIEAALEVFRPDVLVVDKVPRGVGGELEETLLKLRRRGTRCILGLRDILDAPEAVAREWAEADNEDAIRDFYDEVWVYGDRRVLDQAAEYGFSDETSARLDYVGYLDRRISTRATLEQARLDFEAHAPAGRFVLCSVGGGEDGARLADAFSQTELPGELAGLLLTGPFMPARVRRRLLRRAADNPRLHVVDFVREPGELVRRAERVISMGGYNSVCEIVSHQKRALIVPRVVPRREQWIRAARFRALGLLEVCHPAEIRPSYISGWLERQVSQPDRSRIDLRGLVGLQARLTEAFPALRDAEPVAA
jgi:predicted glycosyltransferase